MLRTRSRLPQPQPTEIGRWRMRSERSGAKRGAALLLQWRQSPRPACSWPWSWGHRAAQRATQHLRTGRRLAHTHVTCGQVSRRWPTVEKGQHPHLKVLQCVLDLGGQLDGAGRGRRAYCCASTRRMLQRDGLQREASHNEGEEEHVQSPVFPPQSPKMTSAEPQI